MTSFPLAPRVVKGGLALVNPTSGALLRVIALQYNPETLTRSLQIQTIGESADRSDVMRIKGPPIETIKVDAEIDATDQLEQPDQNRGAVESGIQAQLAALEVIVYPTTAQLQATNTLARQGTLEIAPMESPLVLFIWSSTRIIPVRITELSVTEEAFDPHLNPIRAKVSLGLRVLSVTDLGFEHKGGSLYLMYQRQKERFASMQTAAISALGLGGIP
jgi:hypothetical protein